MLKLEFCVIFVHQNILFFLDSENVKTFLI